MCTYPLIFKKYHCYEDLIESYPRVTRIVQVLYEIDEKFAFRYLFESNKLIFNSFVKDIITANNAFKEVFNRDWSLLFKIAQHKVPFTKVLNVRLPKFCRNIDKRVKFWKMVQENKRFFMENLV